MVLGADLVLRREVAIDGLALSTTLSEKLSEYNKDASQVKLLSF